VLYSIFFLRHIMIVIALDQIEAWIEIRVGDFKIIYSQSELLRMDYMSLLHLVSIHRLLYNEDETENIHVLKKMLWLRSSLV
jgi:hypothetical protein